MKNYILLDAISGIDSDIIAEHIKFKERTAARSSRLLRVLPIAAALVILTVLALAVLPALLPDDPVPPIITDAPTDAPIVTETPETSIFDNPNIIWGSDLNDGMQGWNGLLVTSGLAHILHNNSENKMIAVSFRIKSDIPFVYKDKTLNEYSSNIQECINRVLLIKRLIYSDWRYWEQNLNNPEGYQIFMRKFGGDIYQKCFEKESHVFIKEGAEAIRKEAENQLIQAQAESNEAFRAYYDVFYPLSVFTEKFDSLGIPYVFLNREIVRDEYYDETDLMSIPPLEDELYVPGRQDIVLLVTNESFAKLDIDDITGGPRSVVFYLYGRADLD